MWRHNQLNLAGQLSKLLRGSICDSPVLTRPVPAVDSFALYESPSHLGRLFTGINCATDQRARASITAYTA